ncbi:Aldo-keto reductase [Mycena kentingensis (nom. inval.)]|nr:Aldo-keto reductase [Mycena kentingensis (nom. inval.)]
MPWSDLPMNDGRHIPSIAIGTWKMGNGKEGISRIAQGLGLALLHIDTAQNYRNEYEAGIAIRESGLPRDKVFVATKFSGVDGKGIQQSMRESLANLGIGYVDLYLIHGPELVYPDIPGAWREMEELHAYGLARSIGVSNFEIKDLATLLTSAKIKPVVNQIRLHPYIYKEAKPLMEYSEKNEILIEAYSPLLPITRFPGGALDEPLAKIASRMGVTNDQVLLAWAKAKSTVVVTASSKKERLLGYIDAGDIELTSEDIAAIDDAGAKGAPR